jgi:hypothetical protein
MENQGVLTTYKAILRGDHLEWRNDVRVSVSPDRAVAVYVTVLDEPVTPTLNPQDQGRRMAAALAQLAQLNACADITDPVAWERQMRQERALPNREA